MRILLLLTVILSGISGSIVNAMDNPLRPALTPVFSDQIQSCEHLVLAKCIAGEKTEDQDGGTSTFQIVEIGFSHGDRFQLGQLIKMRGKIPAPSDANYALMGRDDRTEGWYSPLKVSADAWTYLSSMPLPTIDPEAHAKRPSWFLKYLEHPDPAVSADAFAEFSAVPWDFILPLKDKFPREKILAALANPGTPATRIAFYGLMAGHCARPEDADILEKKVVILDGDYRLGIEGVMVGYLLVRGEDGLKVLVDTKMRSRVAKNAEGTDLPLPFRESYAAMQALRFMWTYEPDHLPKQRLRQSMQFLLDRPVMADLVITELARWKDWSVQDRLMSMSTDEAFAIPAIQRAILRYLYVCSQEKTELDEDGILTPTGDAVKAEANLRILNERDPKTFERAMRYLIKVPAASSAKDRRAPIPENAEFLERIARDSSFGLMGCGDGVLHFVDHSGRPRRIFSGLCPIHVFGDKTDAETLAVFLEARAKANEDKEGAMYGERRFLLVTILDVVKLSEDAGFIDLLAPLLYDPIPQVHASAESALLCIADRNAARRTQVLEMLNKRGWNQFWSRGNRDWIPYNGQQ